MKSKDFLIEGKVRSKAKIKDGFVVDVEKETLKNKNYRKVLFTSKIDQLVVMSLKPGEEIGEEVHDGAQFFRIEQGTGKSIINGKSHKIKDGSAIVVPKGSKHNIINTGSDELKLYTVYSPPQHKDGLIEKNKPSEVENEKDIPERKLKK